jgi:alanine transaminase
LHHLQALLLFPNRYGAAPKFTSFKRALAELRRTDPALAAQAQLVSFHSTSKGFFGECGLRGGYFELQNVPAEVRAQLTKLASISLCSNLVGQFATGLMVKPPVAGEPSFTAYQSERGAILASLSARATKVAAALNALPGVSCNAAEGAMYLFPQLHLPARAVQAAKEAGMPADEFYCIKLLEQTGLVVVPGSGFKQAEGTFHFRTTFLPPEDVLEDILPKLRRFQEKFMADFAGSDEL